MNRYSSFLGKRVEAQYRVAEIHQHSVGTLVSDTGESVVIEEHFSQDDRKKTMRVEIPYEYVIRIVEASQNLKPSIPSATAPQKKNR